jgi:hypothetical protein
MATRPAARLAPVTGRVGLAGALAATTVGSAELAVARATTAVPVGSSDEAAEATGDDAGSSALLLGAASVAVAGASVVEGASAAPSGAPVVTGVDEPASFEPAGVWGDASGVGCSASLFELEDWPVGARPVEAGSE